MDRLCVNRPDTRRRFVSFVRTTVRTVGVVVVAGAGGGIGAAICRMFAEQARSEYCSRARAWRVDLTDADAVATFVDAAAAEFGGVHTVVYAPGPHVPMLHLSRVTPAQYRE